MWCSLGIIAACTDGILETGLLFGGQDTVFDSDTGSSSEGNTGTDTRGDSDSAGGSDSSSGPLGDTDSNGNHDTDSMDTGSDNDSDSSLYECQGGVRFSDICFYMSEEYNVNCLELCEGKGGYNERTPLYIGKIEEGGSRDNCEEIVRSIVELSGFSRDYVEQYIAVQQVPLSGFGVGLGCYFHRSFGYCYGGDVAFDETHKTNLVLRVCGCGPDLPPL